jgi:hypothetical protein
MSNHNKPTFRIGGAAPPPPLAPPPIPAATELSATVAGLLAKFPLPWCVGPDGYLWVAADVEKVTDRDELNKIGVTPDGWRATGSKCRLVLEHALPADFAELVLYTVNKLAVR